MNSWCAPSCPQRRSFVASNSHSRGQFCTITTRPNTTYNSGNAVQTIKATSDNRQKVAASTYQAASKPIQGRTPISDGLLPVRPGDNTLQITG